MGRNLSPKYRFARRIGQPLMGTEKERKILARRKNPPGQITPSSRRRGKISDYGVQLLEKQKMRYLYHVSEKQLRRAVAEAKRRHGDSGENLMAMMELRLDNAIYKMGFAPTIWSARQLVSHKHCQVNGKSVNIPGYQLRPGDVVSIREKSRNMRLIRESLSKQKGAEAVPYYVVDADKLEGRVDHVPFRGEMQIPVDVHLVIEFYAR